jgi:predicted GH43/DUF377 family glycosyl hydrolase
MTRCGKARLDQPVHLDDKIRTTEENKMNKRHRFLRLCGFFLVLASFALGGWRVSARSLAAPFIPGAWTKYAANPVFNPGASGAWDDQWVFGPSVILDGSTYKMWYTSYSAASTSKKIGYATSPDGLTWTKYGTAAVLYPGATGQWDAKGVFYPTVIKDGGTYKMWYTGVNASSIGQVGYATSPDGIVWTKSANNPVLGVGATGSWDSTYAGMASVVKVGTTYKLWYRGGSVNGGAIGYAISPDGMSWTKQGLAITGGSLDWDDTPYQPEVIYDGMVYHMWYSGMDVRGNLSQEGYATSTDGAHWTRKGMILPQGASGAWDDNSADNAAVLLAGSTLKMWYSGHDGLVYRIGYAVASISILNKGTYIPLVVR